MAGDILTPMESSDLTLMGEVEDVQESNPFIDLGSTGLKRTGGYLDEEFLPHLKGTKAVKVYREMGDNDPIAGASLYGITNLLRGVDWQVIPGGKNREAAMAARLIETAMDDMSESWADTIQEISSFVQYGWSWHEISYKRRIGPWEKDGKCRSKYTDGLIGWKGFPIRSQDSLHRWIFNDAGDVIAMVQMAPPDYKTRVLPITKSLLFRYGRSKNNPEGFSVFRRSYRPWYYKKRLEEFESVGVERDLAGLPMVTVPASYLRAGPNTEQGKMVAAMRKMVRSVRRNEQEGLVFPIEYDQDTKQPLFKFELLSSGGARQHDTDKLIRRYEERQLQTTFSDWLMVGHQSTGTYNMHVDKTGIYREALNATCMSMADVFTRHAIPRLFALNGWHTSYLPKIVPSSVDEPDLAQLAQFLTATAGLGFVWGPDADIERMLRKAAGLPEMPDGDEQSRRRDRRMTEATNYAELQARYLAARSQVVQAQAAEEAMSQGVPTPDMQMQQQQIAQGQQQMEQGAANEQRTAQQHEQAQGEHLFTALGGGEQQQGAGGAKKGPKA